MYIHRFKINELERDQSSYNKDVLYYVRRFWTLYTDRSDNKQDKLSAQLETRVVKPNLEFSISLEVGNAGSSTPWDGHLKLFGSAVYWGFSGGRKLAQRLTTSEREKYDSRAFTLRIHDGCLWVKFWVPENRWMQGEFSKWRDRSFRLNLLDILYGEKQYRYDYAGEPVETTILLPEGSYPVTLTPQRVVFGRPKGKRLIESWSVDVDAPKGIPNRHDHSGGWKGDRVYGFAVEMKQPKEDWVVDARNLVASRILKDRGDSGFRKLDILED